MEDVLVLHNFRDDHNKLYAVRIERVGQAEFRVIGSYGASSDTYLKDHIKGTRHTLDQAEGLAVATARSKEKGGYRYIDDMTYRRDCPCEKRVRMKQALAKIDTTRLASKWAARPQPVPSPVPVVDEPEQGGPARRERNLLI